MLFLTNVNNDSILGVQYKVSVVVLLYRCVELRVCKAQLPRTVHLCVQ